MGIVDEFRRSIRRYPFIPRTFSSGTVLRVGDGIAWASGLSLVGYGELVKFENGKIGMVSELRQEEVGILLINETDATVGMQVFSTGTLPSIPVGEEVLGRVIDPMGNPLDGGMPLPASDTYPVERPAPPISWRAKVNEPVETGILALDLLVPIGHGQRELVLGDRSTGKSTLALTILAAQRGKDVINVYVSIGQKESDLAAAVQTLTEMGVMDQTVIVAATAAMSPLLRYLAPYAGTSVGEWFMHRGKKVVVIYDDLSKHAISHREISLLLKRPPGREAYPGDIFYTHSRLLERAAKLNAKHGGGSLTAIPICETQLGDFSAYIPTNLVSITDGQIYLDAKLFAAGRRPAVNPGLSVSRVGGSAQYPAIRKLAGRLRVDLARYEELATFVQFGGKLDPESEKILIRGQRTVEVLKQDAFEIFRPNEELIILVLLTEGKLDPLPVKDVRPILRDFLSYLRTIRSNLIKLPLDKPLGEEEKSEIYVAFEKFMEVRGSGESATAEE